MRKIFAILNEEKTKVLGIDGVKGLGFNNLKAVNIVAAEIYSFGEKGFDKDTYTITLSTGIGQFDFYQKIDKGIITCKQIIDSINKSAL